MPTKREVMEEIGRMNLRDCAVANTRLDNGVYGVAVFKVVNGRWKRRLRIAVYFDPLGATAFAKQISQQFQIPRIPGLWDGLKLRVFDTEIDWRPEEAIPEDYYA